MRVFGDLNEDPSPADPSGSRAAGTNGNLNEGDVSHAAGNDRAMENEPLIESGEYPGMELRKPVTAKGSD